MKKRYYTYITVYLIALILILPWGFIQPAGLKDLRNIAFDNYQRLSPRNYDPETPIRIVGVDEISLKAYGQWPWPRQILIDVVQRLKQLGASAIVFDFIFAEPARENFKQLIQLLPKNRVQSELSKIHQFLPDADNLLAAEFSQAPVVLGMALTNEGPSDYQSKSGVVTLGDEIIPFLIHFPAYIKPLPVLFDSAIGVGFTNWLPDHDQVVRDIPLLMDLNRIAVGSLSLEALRVAQGAQNYIVRSSNANSHSAFGKKSGLNAIKVGNIEIQTGSASEVRPHYSFTNEERYLSVKDVIENKVNKRSVDGKIIIIGAKATGLGDARATPLEPAVPGVEIHAQLLESLISDELLSRPDWALGFEIIIAFFSLSVIMAQIFFMPSLMAGLFWLCIMVAIPFGSYEVFNEYSVLIDAVYPSLAVIVSTLIAIATVWRVEASARVQIREAFGKYVSPSVVEAIAESPDLLVLGGESKELTVLFCDMHRFSAISENLNAKQLTQLMNDFFTPMTDAILIKEGTIDKYMGDAIMAFWNAPLDIAEHPRKAVEAALSMRHELSLLNNNIQNNVHSPYNLKLPIAFGLGLHCGPCNVGNMGSSRRFDYSVLGDTVNLASRLEGACRYFNTDILASIAVRDAAPDNLWLEIGPIQVVGKTEPVDVFAILEGNTERTLDINEKIVLLHMEMICLFKDKRFSDASDVAKKLQQICSPQWTKFYNHFEEKISSFINTKLPSDWKPTWILTNK